MYVRYDKYSSRNREEIYYYKNMHECGVAEARAVVKKQYLSENIDNIKDIEDVRSFLRDLID